MHHIAERSLITQTALCVRKCTSLHNYTVNEDYKNEDYTSYSTQTPHALTPQILYILTIPSENLKKLSGTARMVGLEQPLYKEQVRTLLRLKKRWLGEQNKICKLHATQRKWVGSSFSLFLLTQEVCAMKGMKRWHFHNKKRPFLPHLLKLGKSSHGFRK